MASSSSSPSAPIFSSQSWNYDVFLSFRGEDTRKTFVDHLYAALDQQGIHTYKDDVTLPRGESISPALLKAIEESQIAVIIFSKNYANSSWCLDELNHIMKCRYQRKQVVMPIFYDVEPFEVRKQKGKFLDAFDKHEMENKAKVECWRKALVEASNISGWETKQIANGHEAHGIKQIVGEISQRLNLVISGANENLIGVRTRVKALKSELQIESGGVRMIGIWGVGGGGKTTLASYLYDEISSMYDGCCFVNNVREESSNGLEKLQEKILSDILKKLQVQKVSRVEEGRHMMMTRLGRKRVLIVLDDVDKHDQLKALVGSRDWFGEGSRIIITTRDENLLNAHKVDVTYQISLLNHDEAVKLFCKHAHWDNKLIGHFEQLSEAVVSYAGGLPLALTVLGSFLCDKSISQWRSALDRLKEIPDENIVGKLRISFDGLKPVEKELFLEIACFFRRREKDKAMKILQACGFHPIIGIEVLRQKALIVITKSGLFDMHDLMEEMGQYIVREKYPKYLHNRVWKREDARRILGMDAKTKLDNTEALNLWFVTHEELQRFLQIASNMNKLRWIDLTRNRWRNEKRYGIILSLSVTFPANFPPKELCYLKLQSFMLHKQLWKGYKDLPNLKHMELRLLPNLIKIPDLAGLRNLETFKLSKCPCLEEVHPSIGFLENLVFLSIGFCPCLGIFPSITGIKKLETLEFIFCKKLEIISEIQQGMDNLPHLHLDNSGKEVAFFKEHCANFFLTWCSGLHSCLPHYSLHQRRLRFLHSDLRKLNLMGFNLGDEEISSGVWELPNLEELDLSGNPLISRLDFSILRLPRLKWLDVTCCQGLVELSELPSSIAVVIANDCCSLESFGDISNCKWLWKVSILEENKLDEFCVDTLIDSMLQGNVSEDYFISVALHDYIPFEFVGEFFREKAFRLHLLDDWYNDFSGFLICIVTDMENPKIKIIMKQEDPPFDLPKKSDEAVESICDEYTLTYIGYVSFGALRHTTMLTSSYNTILLMIDTKSLENPYVGVEFIPRKSKSDEVQTIDCSEFWDKKVQDTDLDTFRIQQCDSESSVKISWSPRKNRYN